MPHGALSASIGKGYWPLQMGPQGLGLSRQPGHHLGPHLSPFHLQGRAISGKDGRNGKWVGHETLWLLSIWSQLHRVTTSDSFFLGFFTVPLGGKGHLTPRLTLHRYLMNLFGAPSGHCVIAGLWLTFLHLEQGPALSKL